MDIDGDGEGAWEDEAMDLDDDTPRKRAKSNTGAARTVVAGAHAPKNQRQLAGMANSEQRNKAVKLRNLGQRLRNMHAKAGESDRAIRVKMPKHLFSGKRGAGKTDRR